MMRWRWLILMVLAVLLAACGAPQATATATYTLLPSATRTALPTTTPTPTAIKQPAGLPRPSPTVRPTASPTPTFLPWTPPPYTPPAPNPLALSPANASQIQELAVLGNGHPVDVAWSRDGRWLAVAVTDWVDLYDTTTWKLAAQYRLPAQEVAFSPTSETLIAASGDTVRWLDLATGTIAREQTFDLSVVLDLVFSPGGTWLAVVGSRPGGEGEASFGLVVTDAGSGAHLYTLGGYGIYPAPAFSPDGRTLALVTMVQTLLFDVDTGHEVDRYDTTGSAVAFSRDGFQLLVMTEVGLQAVTLETGQWQAFPAAPFAWDGFALSPDGRTLMYLPAAPGQADCCPDLFTLRDVATLQTLTSLPADTTSTRVAFSPDSRQVAWVNADNAVQLIDLAAPATPRALRYTPKLTAVSFGPPAPSGAPTVLAGDEHGGLWNWDLSNGQLLSYTPRPPSLGGNFSGAPPNGVTTLFYSVPDELLVMGYASGDLLVTNFLTRQVVFSERCSGVTYPYWDVRVAPGFMAGRCTPADPITVWDLHTGARLAIYDKKFFHVFQQADGQWAISDDPEAGINLTPLNGGMPVPLTYPLGFQHGDYFLVVPNADGRWLALSAITADIVIWDTASGLPLYTLTGHHPLSGEGYAGDITHLLFSPTTDLLASVGYDGTLRLWDVTASESVNGFVVGWELTSDLAFSANGRYLAASTSDGLV